MADEDAEQLAVSAAIVHSGEDAAQELLIRIYERRVRGMGYEPVGLPTVHAKELFRESIKGKRDLYVTQVTGLARKMTDHESGACCGG